MTAFRLVPGLPEAMRGRAAALYWQAFGGKLGRVLGPEPLALRYLTRVIRADHAIVALAPDGALLGLAGFKTHRGGFASGGRGDLIAVYGRTGGLWRAAAMTALQGDTDNARFLIDGLCVADGARGAGIGSALLDAACAEGVARGYSAARLDVTDANLRAQALYLRAGFAITGTQRLGMLRHVFGFDATLTMVRPLCLA